MIEVTEGARMKPKHQQAGARQPVHLFLGGKGLRHPTRNECMGWFAQISTNSSRYPFVAYLLAVAFCLFQSTRPQNTKKNNSYKCNGLSNLNL